MIFKHKTNGQVANIVDLDLIEEYKNNDEWEEGSYEDLPKPFVPEPIKLTYEQLVSQKIHARYSIDDELALINNKDIHPEEYQAYQDYRQQCKDEAKAEIAARPVKETLPKE